MNETINIRRFEEPIIVVGSLFLLFFFFGIVIKNTARSNQSQPASAQMVSVVKPQPAEQEIDVTEDVAQEAVTQPPAAILTTTAEIQNSLPTEDKIVEFIQNDSAPTDLVQSDSIQNGLTDTINICTMKDWGIEFPCDMKWMANTEDEPGNIKFILSQEPLITFGWKRFDQDIHFLGQLNNIFFEKIGFYQNGFGTERVNLAGYDAVLVKGYSAEIPDTQQRDYFYLHNNKLVGVSFTLSPADKWEEGKLLIQKVKNSFSTIR